MRRLELVDRWKWVGYCFPLHDSLATENDCSCKDGADKLFWGIKKLSSRYFLVAVTFFSHFIGKCQGKHALR